MRQMRGVLMLWMLPVVMMCASAAAPAAEQLLPCTCSALSTQWVVDGSVAMIAPRILLMEDGKTYAEIDSSNPTRAQAMHLAVEMRSAMENFIAIRTKAGGPQKADYDAETARIREILTKLSAMR